MKNLAVNHFQIDTTILSKKEFVLSKPSWDAFEKCQKTLEIIISHFQRDAMTYGLISFFSVIAQVSRSGPPPPPVSLKNFTRSGSNSSINGGSNFERS
jgi:hypothetical protein